MPVLGDSYRRGISAQWHQEVTQGGEKSKVRVGRLLSKRDNQEKDKIKIRIRKEIRSKIESKIRARSEANRGYGLKFRPAQAIPAFSVAILVALILAMGGLNSGEFSYKARNSATKPGAKMRLAVLMHLYYQDLWLEFATYIGNIPLPFDLFVNLVEGNPNNAKLRKTIRRRFWYPMRKVVVQETENRGRDIGGFLRLIDRVLKTGRNYDAVILMHSKKTLHQDPKNGVNWRTSLLLSILAGRKRIRKIAGMFQADPRLGMVGCKYWLFNDDNRPDLVYCHNKPLIDAYCRRFKLSTEKNDFIAGTMFWVRAKPFLGFFARHDPLALAAELEPGDLQDYHKPTRTHAWERIFGYLITSQGYSIGGVDIPLVMEPPPIWKRAWRKMKEIRRLLAQRDGKREGVR